MRIQIHNLTIKSTAVTRCIGHLMHWYNMLDDNQMRVSNMILLLMRFENLRWFMECTCYSSNIIVPCFPHFVIMLSLKIFLDHFGPGNSNSVIITNMFNNADLGPLLLYWIKHQHGYVNISITKSGMELLIHSQISTVQPFKFSDE